MRHRFAFVSVVLSWLSLPACQFSTVSGQSGQADFTARDCGALLDGLPGCDLKKGLAQGGQVTISATAKQSGAILTLSTTSPAFSVMAENSGYTISGLAPGKGELLATSAQTEIDRLTLTVTPIARLAYSALSDANGKFEVTPIGDVDGTFSVNKGLSKFSLLFAPIDSNGNPLIGRGVASYDLPAGLSLTKDPGAVLSFEFNRPPVGEYILGLRAKSGGATAKIKIIVKD